RAPDPGGPAPRVTGAPAPRPPLPAFGSPASGKDRRFTDSRGVAMLTLTQTAVGAIEALVGDAPLAEGIRISTAAQADGSTGLALALAEAPAVSDQVIEDGDARVFLEP